VSESLYVSDKSARGFAVRGADGDIGDGFDWVIIGRISDGNDEVMEIMLGEENIIDDAVTQMSTGTDEPQASDEETADNSGQATEPTNEEQTATSSTEESAQIEEPTNEETTDESVVIEEEETTESEPEPESAPEPEPTPEPSPELIDEGGDEAPQ